MSVGLQRGDSLFHAGTPQCHLQAVTPSRSFRPGYGRPHVMGAGVGREVEVDRVFGQTGGVATYFDALSEGREQKIVVNWIVQVLFGQLAAKNQTFTGNPNARRVDKGALSHRSWER